MPERLMEVDDQQLLDKLEPVARRLLEPESDEQRAEAQGELQLVLEFALCELMRINTRTAGFWCDGIELQQIALQPDGRVRCIGSAWCANKDQWRVPLFVELAINGSELARIDVGLGDGELDSLAQHKGRRLQVPDSWLERYCIVPGIRDPQLDPLIVIRQLQQWLSDNPYGRIVGPDWEYLSVEAARRFVHEEASRDRYIILEPTWLDGASAMQVIQKPSVRKKAQSSMITLHKSAAELEGTAYIELLPGPYLNECWGPNSVFFDEETFGFVEPIFVKACPDYDHYAFTEIGRPLWHDILREMDDLLGILRARPTNAVLAERLGFLFRDTERKFFEDKDRHVVLLQEMVLELTNWLRERLEEHEVISVLGL